jgi:hypothetical protein
LRENSCVIALWLAENRAAHDKKLIEKSQKAPKGRNAIAWGIAPGIKSLLLPQALKGRNMYVALSGLY